MPATCSPSACQSLPWPGPLVALERHLDDRHLQTFLVLCAASLLRPEVCPFLGISALWLWWAEPARRWLVIAVVVLLPVLWFGPDLVGSGDALRSLHRAGVPTEGGPLLGSHPGLDVLRSAGRYLLVPFGLVALAGAAGAAGDALRRRSDRTTRTVMAVAGAWLAVEVAVTEAGRSSGDQRYLIVAGATGSVLAGIGWARVTEGAARLAAGRRGDDR